MEPKAPKPQLVHLTICATCTDTTQPGEAGIGGGGQLHKFVSDQWRDHPSREQLDIRHCRCLMACTEGCVASVAQAGKMQYLLGRLPATPDTAAKVLDFAGMYAESDTGVVPNHLWPKGLGMNFLGRIPPLEPNPDGDWRQDSCDL